MAWWSNPQSHLAWGIKYSMFNSFAAIWPVTKKNRILMWCVHFSLDRSPSILGQLNCTLVIFVSDVVFYMVSLRLKEVPDQLLPVKSHRRYQPIQPQLSFMYFVSAWWNQNLLRLIQYLSPEFFNIALSVESTKHHSLVLMPIKQRYLLVCCMRDFKVSIANQIIL